MPDDVHAREVLPSDVQRFAVVEEDGGVFVGDADDLAEGVDVPEVGMVEVWVGEELEGGPFGLRLRMKLGLEVGVGEQTDHALDEAVGVVGEGEPRDGLEECVVWVFGDAVVKQAHEGVGDVGFGEGRVVVLESGAEGGDCVR